MKIIVYLNIFVVATTITVFILFSKFSSERNINSRTEQRNFDNSYNLGAEMNGT